MADDGEVVINVKKLTYEEKSKIKKALKKKKRRNAKAVEAIAEHRQLVELAEKIAADESTAVDNEEEDDYLVAGKLYEDYKHVFAQYRQSKADNLDRLLMDDEEEERERIEAEKEKAEKERLQREADDQNKEIPVLSKKKKKQLKRMQVAQLKVLVKRPDLVEAWDVTAPDPLFLIQLKSYKNTVPVPRHWCQKRKFLQNKRGILKPPFKLPDYIEATGISRLRDPLSERDGARMIRQKLRERMNPKLGKIDIDYEVLHDAFFVHQKKPHMTIHGDIYFEGKEDEVKMRSYKPGKISEDLRRALGIAENANPPWLVTMQRFGPPPSYPHLKIPGLNSSAISDSQWNLYLQKAAEDEEVAGFIESMYGDRINRRREEAIDKSYFGALREADEVNDYESEAGIENEIARKTETYDLSHLSFQDKSEKRDNFSSGLETPSFTEIRKNTAGMTSGLESRQPEVIKEEDDDAPAKPLFKVMDRKEPKEKDGKGGFLAPDFKYDVKN